jgi:hypothetical protein
MPAGTWRAIRVSGVMVTAEKTDRIYQPAMVGMQAVIHVAPEASGHGTPTDFVPGDNASTPRGKVTMLRGDVVTIALDSGASSMVPEPGDELRLQYTVAGESLVVGTWRVTGVGGDNTVEAEPVELIQPPSIGYQAVFLPKAEPATPVARTPPPSEEQPVDTPPASTSEHAAVGAGRTETDVTLDFSGMQDKTPCGLGSVRLHDSGLEMRASKGDTEEYCLYAIATQDLEHFRVSANLEVDGKDFMVGFAYGNLKDPTADTMMAYLATMNTKVGSGRKRDEVWGAWLGSISVTRQGRSDTGFMKDPWFEEDDPSDNPTPGTLEFTKDGPDCSLSWNGEQFLAWREDEIQAGMVGIMFKPIDGRRNIAAFSAISVKRLD